MDQSVAKCSDPVNVASGASPYAANATIKSDEHLCGHKPFKYSASDARRCLGRRMALEVQLFDLRSSEVAEAIYTCEHSEFPVGQEASNAFEGDRADGDTRIE